MLSDKDAFGHPHAQPPLLGLRDAREQSVPLVERRSRPVFVRLFTLAVRSSGGSASNARQRYAALRPSPLLSQEVFQNRIAEHCICQKPLQLRALILWSLQPFCLRHIDAAGPGLPC